VPWQGIEGEIQRGLEQVRRLLHVDRASVFDFEENKGFTLRYSVVDPQLKTELAPAYLSTEQVPWSLPQLLRGETLLINNLAELPQDAVEKKVFGHRPVCSAAIVPLGTEGSLAGVLSLVSVVALKTWPREIIPQLKIVGEIFYNALQRKHVMQALAESEQRFRHTADSAPMLVWMSGTDKLFTYFNQGWLEFTGRQLEQELGEGWVAGVHPDDVETCLSTYGRAFDVRQQFRMEYRLRRHDGAYRWLLDIGVPRFDANRSFLGFIGSCIDITDRKSAEEAVLSFGGKLINAQEEERRRIARELHDDVGQRLALLTIELDKLRETTQPLAHAKTSSLWSQANEIAHTVRQISHNLHSSGLDWLGLPAALDGLCREFPQGESIKVNFSHHNVPPRLSAEVKLCFYRVVQEALQNISKHSHARSVEIVLQAANGELTLEIKDDGVGFPLELEPISGLGLASMRERLKSVGGAMRVTSGPTRGTTIHASVPLSEVTAKEISTA
jgi:PAS domain S-box-containing protein